VRGGCYQHVQAITVAIDQYAESALGNRDFFLNKPHSIGGNRIPAGLTFRNGATMAEVTYYVALPFVAPMTALLPASRPNASIQMPL
jgi:hypothetical protein